MEPSYTHGKLFLPRNPLTPAYYFLLQLLTPLESPLRIIINHFPIHSCFLLVHIYPRAPHASRIALNAPIFDFEGFLAYFFTEGQYVRNTGVLCDFGFLPEDHPCLVHPASPGQHTSWSGPPHSPMITRFAPTLVHPAIPWSCPSMRVSLSLTHNHTHTTYIKVNMDAALFTLLTHR